VGTVQWNLYCANAESLGGCNNFDDDCDGIVDDCTRGIAGSCCGSSGCSSFELCNGLDDDCNGIIDDNPVDVGVACGNNTGDCAVGVYQCCTSDAGVTCPGHQPGDVRVCLGGNAGYPRAADACDGTDDDCDGVANGGAPQACYTNSAGATLLTPAQAGVGQCRAGTQSCLTAPLAPGGCGFPAGKSCPNPVATYSTCVNAIGPTAEVCNGLDDNCDGTPDENVTDVWVGAPCCPTGNLADCQNSGGATRCKLGAYQCSGGQQTCVGAVAKAEETCDGVDNDCNGAVDDVPGAGVPCSVGGASNAGACRATFACAASAGACDGQPCPNGLTCVQQVGPQPEVCNGVDDDCDGLTDEADDVAANDPAVGKACDAPAAPADQPPCKGGTSVCAAGQVVCEGAVRPVPNACGGVATDCTGNANATGTCPSGSTCFQGNCDVPCASGSAPCPGGYSCDAAQSLCVPSPCLAAKCPASEVCRLGSDGAATCVDPCDGVTCPTGYACSTGACRLLPVQATSGCSCDVTAPMLPAVLLAAALLRRRRRSA
jgi:MYXO-CTERM domain-containing protein